MNIPIDYINPPSDVELVKKHDAADKKIGDIITSSLADYEMADFIIVGSPQDVGVVRNEGRAGARKAPKHIRAAFYNMAAPSHIPEIKIMDLGNVQFVDSLEKTHAIQSHIVYQLLSDGKRIIILGGGNDISYPDAKAIHKFRENYLAFNIDSHLDVRDMEPRNSGTPYRQLLEERYLKPENFYEIAVKPLLNADVYLEYLKKLKVNIISLPELRRSGIDNVFGKALDNNKIRAVFWGIDMDSVRSADAPGVSATHPVGLSADELCHIGEIAGADNRSSILEITEVNPEYDINDQTSRLAATVMLHYINKATKNT